MDDSRLLHGIRGRDQRMFELLYRRYQPRLRRFVATLTRRPQVIEEVVNDTLMTVWESASTFKGESKLSTWMFTIAYRKTAKALRRQDEPVEDSEYRMRPSLERGPEEEAGLGRLQRQLGEAMKTLSLQHQAVVTMTYYQDLGYKEIAEIMGCPVETVKTRMFYARRHLRRELGGDPTNWI